MKNSDKASFTHFPNDRFISGLNRLVMILSTLSLAGLFLLPGRSIFVMPVWLGLVLLASLFNVWNLMQKQTGGEKDRALTCTNLSLWLILSVQILSGCATLFSWKLLWGRSPLNVDNLPVWAWIIATTMGIIVLSLLNGRQNQVILFSKRETSFLLASPVWTILAGIGIKELIYFYFRNREISPLDQWDMLALNIGLAFFVFHFVLLLALLRIPKINLPTLKGRAARPRTQALVVAVVFVLVSLFIFRIGYSVYDDIYIVSLAAGYPSGEALPYLVYINALLGLVFKELYSLPTNINWYTFFLVGMDFLSIWGMVYLILSRPKKPFFKIMGVLTVLACNSYFLLNPTYTTLAAFAAMAGLGVIFAACEKDQALKKGRLISGIALVTFASLVRLLPVLMILLLVSPLVLIYIKSLKIKSLFFGGGLTVVLILVFWGLNALYLQGSPEWETYYEYNAARIKVFDTPRQTNLKETIDDIGWSKVDLAAFQHSFFPDARTFSRESLEFIAAHTSDKKGSLPSIILSVPEFLNRPYYLSYGLVLISALTGILLLGLSIKKELFASFSLLGLSLAVIVYLLWTQKLPDRVLMPVMTVNALAAWLILLWSGTGQVEPNPMFPYLGQKSVSFFMFLAVILIITQSSESSRWYIEKQQTYQKITSDIETLQDTGVVAPNALIVSPTHGIPLEWANPLYMDFPRFRYMSMGWQTFSPAYEEVLRQAGATSLPEGLYENDNLYLMTDPGRLSIIIKFIKQHKGIDVTSTEIMDLSKYTNDQVYIKVHLYKLEMENH